MCIIWGWVSSLTSSANGSFTDTMSKAACASDWIWFKGVAFLGSLKWFASFYSCIVLIIASGSSSSEDATFGGALWSWTSIPSGNTILTSSNADYAYICVTDGGGLSSSDYVYSYAFPSA